MRAATLALLSTLVLSSGCAGGPPGTSSEEDQVPRPEWRIGDRWVFRRTTASGVAALVTHQITEVTAQGYTMRIVGLAQEVTRYWTGDLHLVSQMTGGTLAGMYEPPVMYFAWPLTLGKVWTQELQSRDGGASGRALHTWRVAPGIDRVDVLAGSFYTVRIEHVGSQGERLETYWYTPRVRYWVRLESALGRYTEELVEVGAASGS